MSISLKKKNPKPKEVKKFFKENFFFDKEQEVNNNGIMTGYYEPEIKAYKHKKKNTYPLYKMNIKKYGETIFKSTREEINKGLLKNKGLELAWVENEIEAFFFIFRVQADCDFLTVKLKELSFPVVMIKNTPQ